MVRQAHHERIHERCGLALALLLALALPSPVEAQSPARIGGAPLPGGTIVGRVCADLDGDGRCGPGEPGVAGARVFTAAGQVALSDARGRWHLLEVPARVLEGDRLAYGGQRVAVQGLATRGLVDLAPEGATQVDLPVAVPSAAPPALESAGVAGPGPRREGDVLVWPLGGRTAPGARVSIGGAEVVAGADGAFALEVRLAQGDNPFAVTVTGADGGAALYRWPVHLSPRLAIGDLVIPAPPVRLASFGVFPGEGGVLVHGTAAPGARVLAGGVVAEAEASGAFAAWVPGADPRVEVRLAGDAPAASLPVTPRRAGLEAVGLAEVEVAFGGGQTLVSGRGTGAVRGTVGTASLEAGVDVDDRDRSASDLLRPRDAHTLEHALVPERTFLATGDDGAADDRNAARGRVWARLRAPDLSVDLGGTRSGLGAAGAATGGELGRYDRALFGARVAAGRDLGAVRLEASAFGATLRADARGNVPPSAARESFAATGGAFFWLSHGEVVAGSEAVRVEWRDPFTGMLTARRALVRGEDYEVDWTSGRLALARPLPMVAAPAAVETGAPTLGAQATLVIDYLHAAQGPDAEDLWGGRVGVATGPLRLEARGAREERASGDHTGLSAAAALDLGLLALRGEVARSEGIPGDSSRLRSVDGGFGFTPAGAPDDQAAGAVHLEARAGSGPVKLGAWWREREAGYADGTFEEATDARERGATADVEHGAWSGALTWAEKKGAGVGVPATSVPEEVRTLVGRGRWRGERVGLTLEVVDAERESPAAAGETSAGARVDWQADRRLALDLSYHQGLRTSGEAVDPTFAAAGATLDLGRTRFSARGGWGPDLGPRLVASGERGGAGEAVYGTFTVDPDAPSAFVGDEAGSSAALGARRSAGGTSVFTEEQVGRDTFGLRSGRVVGLSLAPLRGVRFALTGERGVRYATSGDAVERSVGAVSAGLVLGKVRVGARGELRREGGGHADAAAGSIEWRIAAPLVLSARASWSDGELGGVRARLLELSGGGALRLGRGALLATLTRLEEQRPGALEREGVLGRLAATTEVGRLSFGAGAGLAVQEVAGARDDRLSGSIRASLRVAGPVDVGAEAARRGPLGDGDVGTRSALRAEVGLRLARAGRIALGYHLVGFTGDGLSPEEEAGRLFLRAQLAY